jgi:N-acetylneuraminic acid mutarotase
LTDGFAYNPATDSWRTMEADVPSLSVTAAVWTGSKILLWGVSGSSSAGAVYDPTTDSWSWMAREGQIGPRGSVVVAWTGNELITWGGMDSHHGIESRDGARFFF